PTGVDPKATAPVPEGMTVVPSSTSTFGGSPGVASRLPARNAAANRASTPRERIREEEDAAERAMASLLSPRVSGRQTRSGASPRRAEAPAPGALALGPARGTCGEPQSTAAGARGWANRFLLHRQRQADSVAFPGPHRVGTPDGR